MIIQGLVKNLIKGVDNMRSIKTKLVIYFSCLIIFITTVISFWGYNKAAEGMRNLEERLLSEKLTGDIAAANQYVENYYGVIKYAGGTLVDENGRTIEGRFDMVDAIMKDLGDVATIFVKSDDDFTRITTNIITDNGSRAVGTFLGKDSPAYEVVSKGNTYIGEANILGKPYLTAYDPITDNNGNTVGIIFVGVSKEEAAALISNNLITLRNSFVLILLFGMVVSIAITYFIGKQIADPIIKAVSYAEKIADLDITEDITENITKREDEIGSLGKSIEAITYNLRMFVENVSEASQKVAASSEKLTATTQESSIAAEEVAKTIEEIAKGASDQAVDTEQGVSKVSDLGQLIEKDQQYKKELMLSANEVIKLKDEGFETLEDLVEKTDSNSNASKEIYEAIVNTNKSAEKIENASLMIKNIASQTNLLALNAAIEAARAGESGRGFAVVAEEIRKLAEQSNLFTEEISLVIKDLTSKTENAVDRMKEVSNLVVAQTASVETTRVKFEGISESIIKTKILIEELEKSALIMEDRKAEIIDIIQNLSAIAEENAAGTEEASASVEEQTASMAEISNSSEALAKLAEELQTSIARFKTV